jgi:hypothetical protein
MLRTALTLPAWSITRICSAHLPFSLRDSYIVDDPRIYDLERQKRTPPRAPITFSLEHPLLRIIFPIHED